MMYVFDVKCKFQMDLLMNNLQAIVVSQPLLKLKKKKL